MTHTTGSPDATATSAFEALYRQHLPRVRSYVARYESCPDELDDLIQDVWLRAYLAWPKFRGRGSAEGWLLRVARTACVARYRASVARRRAWERYAPTLAADLAQRLPEMEALEHAREAQEACDRATDALAALPPRERSVATLRLVLGCPTADVATLLGIAPGTVKATLHHATRKLRRVARSGDAPQLA